MSGAHSQRADDNASHLVRTWIMKPEEVNAALAPSPAGAASQLVRAASRNPVRQAAADRPKQAPACVRVCTQLHQVEDQAHCQPQNDEHIPHATWNTVKQASPCTKF